MRLTRGQEDNKLFAALACMSPTKNQKRVKSGYLFDLSRSFLQRNSIFLQNFATPRSTHANTSNSAEKNTARANQTAMDKPNSVMRCMGADIINTNVSRSVNQSTDRPLRMCSESQCMHVLYFVCRRTRSDLIGDLRSQTFLLHLDRLT